MRESSQPLNVRPSFPSHVTVTRHYAMILTFSKYV